VTGGTRRAGGHTLTDTEYTIEWIAALAQQTEALYKSSIDIL